MSAYTWAWLWWLGMFIAIEVPAIVNRRPGDTLSEHLRSWFATRAKPVQWRLRRLALLLFLVWLVVHLFLGW